MSAENARGAIQEIIRPEDAIDQDFRRLDKLRYEEFVDQFCKQLRIVGFSLGGMVATAFGLDSAGGQEAALIETLGALLIGGMSVATGAVLYVRQKQHDARYQELQRSFNALVADRDALRDQRNREIKNPELEENMVVVN